MRVLVKRALLGLLALALLLGAVLLANTLRQGSRQLQVPPLPPLAVDTAAAAESLATALRARTVSGLLDPDASAAAFDALHAHLRQRYPLVHARLQREVVGGHTLVYSWAGRDPALAPVALLSHQDVVPVAPGTEALWKQPPFSGAVADGHVWGRGALDDKGSLIAQFEAVEMLLRAGFEPARTVYLILGHDEEVGGQRGALQVATLLRQRGVRLEWLLDEGMAVTEGLIPGVARPVALIGLAEKGYLTLKLTAQAAPGHASMPPAPGNSAIGMLSAALARLDAQPLPGGVSGVLAEMFAAVAPEMPLGQRLALTNLWLLGPLVEPMLARSPATNALMRTTTALTVVNAGNKDNVLPGRAEAVVNLRLLPGDTAASATAQVRRIVADERIEVATLGPASEPSPVSSTSAAGYRAIERSIREVFPDALVAPGLVAGATDARHFRDMAAQAYRFVPMRFTPQDLPRVHGTDERLAVAQLADMVRFYHRLLQQPSL